MYRVSTEEVTYASNTTVRPGKFGGWYAMNIGTANAKVNGYPIPPMCGLDFTHLHPEAVWAKPIEIIVEPGAQVRMTRFIYQQTAK